MAGVDEGGRQPRDGLPVDRLKTRLTSPRTPRTANVILLTRLGGPKFALNQDLIERADATPDTVVTLVDGTKYVVTESLPELVELVRMFRASLITEAHHLEHQTRVVTRAELGPNGTVVQLHRREP